jgi:hypothetical protein
MSETRPIDVIRRCSSLDRREIVIPEWEDMKLYFGKMTAAAWDGVEARKPKTDMDRHLLLLIKMAMGEDGKPAFNMGDREYLKTEAALPVLQKVINFMYEGVYESVEQAEEAIEGNPCSGSDSNSESS